MALSEDGQATLRELAVPAALGFSYEEVARITGVPQSQVGVRMRRLRREILDQLEQQR